MCSIEHKLSASKIHNQAEKEFVYQKLQTSMDIAQIYLKQSMINEQDSLGHLQRKKVQQRSVPPTKTLTYNGMFYRVA